MKHRRNSSDITWHSTFSEEPIDEECEIDTDASLHLAAIFRIPLREARSPCAFLTYALPPIAGVYSIDKIVTNGAYGLVALLHNGRGAAFILKISRIHRHELEDDGTTSFPGQHNQQWSSIFERDFWHGANMMRQVRSAVNKHIFLVPEVVHASVVNARNSSVTVGLLIMPVAAGISVRQRLGQLAADQQGRIIRKCVLALKHLHDTGYIHGDCHVGNIMISDNDSVLTLIDFDRTMETTEKRLQLMDLAALLSINGELTDYTELGAETYFGQNETYFGQNDSSKQDFVRNITYHYNVVFVYMNELDTFLIEQQTRKRKLSQPCAFNKRRCRRNI